MKGRKICWSRLVVAWSVIYLVGTMLLSMGIPFWGILFTQIVLWLGWPWNLTVPAGGSCSSKSE